jgi:hypothetical protein
MQQGHKEPRGRRAATPEDREKTRELYGRTERTTAATTGKERTQQDIQKDDRTGDRETNNRISYQPTARQGLDTVEGPTPSKTKKANDPYGRNRW